MLIKTQGIVLHSFKYGDSGLIARVLTRELGLQSYLVKGVYKAKSRLKANLFQPLTLLELVVYHKEKTGLHHIKEVRCEHPFESITSDMRKTAIALFMSEMLLHTFRQQESNTETFDFTFTAIRRLDYQHEPFNLFHLLFLVELSSYLGFSPARNYDTRYCYFNLQEGTYQQFPEPLYACLGKEESAAFYKLCQGADSDWQQLSLPATLRRTLLSKIIDYYRYHLEGFTDIRSHKILEEVLN